MIRHILADGREVASVEGLIVPTTGPTAAVYHIAAEFIQSHPESISRKKENKTPCKKS